MSDTSIVPGVCRTTWAPGIRQAVPTRPVAATVLAADFLGGEASGIIQAALNACPVGSAVQLSAGTFLCNNHILINKGVTLKGAGEGLTILRKTNGAIPNKPTGDGYICEEYDAIVRRRFVKIAALAIAAVQSIDRKRVSDPPAPPSGEPR